MNPISDGGERPPMFDEEERRTRLLAATASVFPSPTDRGKRRFTVVNLTGHRLNIGERQLEPLLTAAQIHGEDGLHALDEILPTVADDNVTGSFKRTLEAGDAILLRLPRANWDPGLVHLVVTTFSGWFKRLGYTFESEPFIIASE